MSGGGDFFKKPFSSGFFTNLQTFLPSYAVENPKKVQKAVEDTHTQVQAVNLVESAASDLLGPLFGGEGGGGTGPGAETPELPKRDEVIADILSQQLFTLENRRKTRTVTSQGDSTPLASTVLFGR